MSSCTAHDLEPSTIALENFASSTVIIKESYKNLISCLGKPDRTTMTHYLRYEDDNSYVIDSCEIITYEENGLAYALHDDTTFLYFINFTKKFRNKLTYNNHVLDNDFSVNDASKCFNLPDSCFSHLSGEYEMCGLDTAGFVLNLFSDEKRYSDSYVFYFGTDSCLRGIFFPVKK